MKYFYSHIIEIDTLITELDEMDLSESQKKELAQLIDSSIHHTVLDVILSSLTPTEKDQFLEEFKKAPHNQEMMEKLSSKVETIEDQIKKAVEDLKKELHQDIKEAKLKNH